MSRNAYAVANLGHHRSFAWQVIQCIRDSFVPRSVSQAIHSFRIVGVTSFFITQNVFVRSSFLCWWKVLLKFGVPPSCFFNFVSKSCFFKSRLFIGVVVIFILHKYVTSSFEVWKSALTLEYVHVKNACAMCSWKSFSPRCEKEFKNEFLLVLSQGIKIGFILEHSVSKKGSSLRFARLLFWLSLLCRAIELTVMCCA